MKTLIAVLLSGTLWLTFAMAAEETDSINPRELLDQIRSGSAPLILDTRSETEFAHGHVPGAVYFPFWKSYWLAEDLRQPKDQTLVVYCEHGPRASLTRFALHRRGFTKVLTLSGHMSGWRKAGLPVETADNAKAQ